jgi:hypothetical protein
MLKNKNWVKRRNHPAREVILQDLNYGRWLYELKDEDPNHPEIFNEIDYSEFKERMEDYIKKNNKRSDQLKRGNVWMLHDM